MTTLTAPHLIVDDFLPADVATRLLEEIIAGGPLFAPSLVGGETRGAASDIRSSQRLPGRVGVDLAPFKTAIAARSADLCSAAGIAPFPVHHTECSIVAHGDGDFYRTHIDTRTERSGMQAAHFRVVSCVYYLHREPRAFAGGELRIHALGSPNDEATAIAIIPRHNRLVVFPAFVPHEVCDIVCPDGTFTDSRFSINCWLHRQRASDKSDAPTER